MKKALLSLSFFAFTIFAANAQTEAVTVENPNAPEIIFETETIDYGTIEKGSNGVREFVFTNSGKSPLIISNARGSCGCTVPTWPKEPIKPGEQGVIKVKYDTNRSGPINKSVTITSNAKTPTKVLRIKGNIIVAQTAPVKEVPLAAPVAN